MRPVIFLTLITAVAAACAGGSGDTTAPPAPKAVLAFSPANYTFPPADVGGISEGMNFTLSNSGTGAAAGLSFGMTGTDRADFSILSGSCIGTTSLAPGASCVITAALTPTTTHGSKVGSLAVVSGDGPLAEAVLSGTATAPPHLVLPSVKVFPDAPHGSFTTMTITVTNDGDRATPVFVASIGGPDASQFSITGSGCFGALAPGASCDYSLKFAPTTVGPKNGMFVLTPANGAAAQASIVGNGT